jgi:hypothetical protein
MSSNGTSSTFKNDASQIELQSKGKKRKEKKQDASTGAKAAGTRAVVSQLVAFYFRAPIKAFFRSRVEYAYLIGLYEY